MRNLILFDRNYTRKCSTKQIIGACKMLENFWNELILKTGNFSFRKVVIV